MKTIIAVLMAISIHTFSIVNCAAQSYTPKQIFSFWNNDTNLQRTDLMQKGFRKVYGGPKKEGGYLYLYRNKKAREYLFVHYNDLFFTSRIHYYLPDKSKANVVSLGKKELKPGEIMKMQGQTIYEDGKKYYQIDFNKETP